MGHKENTHCMYVVLVEIDLVDLHNHMGNIISLKGPQTLFGLSVIRIHLQ